MEYWIRTAVPADERKVRELFLEMLRTIYRTNDVKGYGDGDLDRYWSESQDRIYVAEDGQVVAFLSVEVHHDPVDHIYLDDFSVTAAYRNKGIGSALIRAAEAYAEQIGSQAIILHVEKTNTSAMRLYERLGYTVFMDEGNRFLLKKTLRPDMVQEGIMDSLIEKIKEYVMEESRKYKETSEDHYDFWNEHIRYVYKEALDLAKKYGADETVVALGALLHDIALIEKAGSRKDHHQNGKILSDEILDRFSCPQDLKNKVLGCVLNHRSSKNATNIEEICVCDADCLAHMDNIPMLFNSAFNRNGVSLNEVRSWMRDSFEHDYNDLSDRTKEAFLDRYNMIKSVVLGDI